MKEKIKMNKKKVVSIEDRIPKLKHKRKKKANRRLIFYLSIFFVLISIIVYLQSPLSNIKTIEISGNMYLSNEKIIQESKLSSDMNIWTVNEKKTEKILLENPLIDTVKVNRSLPWTIEISLTEHPRIAYIKKDKDFHPILGNVTILSPIQELIGDDTLLVNFKEDNYLTRMTTELSELPIGILNLISEIHWEPVKDNKNRILLYMNDGFIVDGTMRNFAEKMQIYPSIVSQLDPDIEGIIHIGVGAY